MRYFDRFDRHLRLMGRMADAVGVALSEALGAGRLSAPELRGMVLACSHCSEAEACARFLEANPEGAARAPGYCRNREVLNRLTWDR